MHLPVLTVSANCCQLSLSVSASQNDSRYQGPTENVPALHAAMDGMCV